MEKKILKNRLEAMYENYETLVIVLKKFTKDIIWYRKNKTIIDSFLENNIMFGGLRQILDTQILPLAQRLFKK